VIGDIGEYGVQRRMQAAKGRMNSGKNKLEETMKVSRELLLAGTLTSRTDYSIRQFNPGWMGQGRKHKPTTRFDLETTSQPKYVGQQANELTKWMNADSITRHKEEGNLKVPTLRQVLKVDDSISLKQMTKSQLSSMPFDPTVSGKQPRMPANCKKRHTSSYRPAMKKENFAPHPVTG